ncbi:ABC transporter ATP-binding protein [Serratia sp. DD3]|uniref:ABC transporter ATP-binding protein n=1 Tax=Serratia sp. DD3 TaxID=1410619 RepID=UPI0003C52B12|nr:ABC transporter ATP-binding protein [Serratia sp. DD3]KEY58542.1 Fe(3+) ions import ATP-binding protein FbpC [Serratia sp. DD3]
MNTLSLHHIGKSYHGVKILDDICLQVAEGSRTAIVGPSGSGKTTLLRIIAGFEAPDAGELQLQGNTLAAEKVWIPAHQRRIGFVPQDGALFPHFTVAGNIGFALKGSKREKQHHIDKLMDMVALDRRLAKLWPHELSGGQQQRVALARALSQQPTLMLLDEPFSALDTGLRAATRKAVTELLSEAGIATILVTHDQVEALSFADQLAVMRNGRLTQVGPPKDLYLHPVDEPTATFLGDTLILPAQLAAGVAECVLGRVAVDNIQQRGPGRIMLRPEQVLLEPTPQLADSQATITHIDFAGFITTVTLQMNDSNEILEVKTISRAGLDVGAHINLSILGLAHVFTE